ncbi:ion transporter [Thalassospiraceae bacterium LMO-JJ14]|nr:ion transporter [Thalassospiraceae bacterium LMO-JJ14]
MKGRVQLQRRRIYDEGWQSMDGIRETLGNLVDHTITQRFIVFVLFLNAVTLGLDTSPDVMGQYGDLIDTINTIIPVIFVIEVGTRWISRGNRFFKESWNIFDIIIISVSFLPSGSAFSALRALRILRVLHVISLVPRMRHVVAAMIRSLPQIGSILALLVIISYISAVIVTHLYGADYPELFGSIGRSMLTLFQLMTLEGWAAEVVRPVMETHPNSVFLFIPYMLMTAFAILNLFTAVLVDSMQILQQNYTYERSEQQTARVVTTELIDVKADLLSLTQEIKQLRNELERTNKNSSA